MAHRLAAEVEAASRYSIPLAECGAWEQLLTEARVAILENAGKAKKDRADLKIWLMDELGRLRTAFSDQAEFRRRSVLVIQAYRPRLDELQRQESDYREQAKQTDVELSRVRTRKRDLERKRRLSRQRLKSKAPSPLPIVPKYTDLFRTVDPKKGKASSGTRSTSKKPRVPSENYADALKSLQKF